ncbi:malonyl-CoA decarboxylase family protein [Bradyrhizobium sp. CCGUVB4N]|uniref:malonyl-CoA decarboxylase domain-containing protein n=1 Tax=Bradyrhizobium sp. CCGUVB4N TaxID=2949631 RepID=UPI0020B426AB|nr:malonyl-CoA decarboxylase family protein [Bradyrhizobium sp. CCGUVB4N]MCP3380766.1 malonyl-CoA decarboxylase family protein [Bradyrhizobium sp. CCGUVB4N]
MCGLSDATGIRGNRTDPVARFHPGNGAPRERINGLGNTIIRGIGESFGITIDYLYDNDGIEADHEVVARGGTIARSPEVDALLQTHRALARPHSGP